MCFFKRKKENKPQINSKYQKGDFVNFRHRDELYFGWIWLIYYKIVEGKKEIAYDIQIGGQCPAVVKGILEYQILGIKQK